MSTDDRQALIDYLLGLGASEEDLVLHRDDLRSLSSLIALRLGSPTLTLDDVAARAGVPAEIIRRRWRAAGFPDPDPTIPILSEGEAEIFVAMTQVEKLFGRNALLQLTRVIGSATSRVADAVVSTFLVNIPLPEEQGDLATVGGSIETRKPERWWLLHLVGRQHGEPHPLRREHVQGVVIHRGLRQPHAFRLPPEPAPKVGYAPAHLRRLVAA